MWSRVGHHGPLTACCCVCCSVIQAANATGHLNNTIVLFTSDHGEMSMEVCVGVCGCVWVCVGACVWSVWVSRSDRGLGLPCACPWVTDCSRACIVAPALVTMLGALCVWAS